MLAHPITQTALLFGLVVASGLLLTLVNDTFTALSRDRERRKAWHRALVTASLPTTPVVATAPDAAFKVITVKTKPVPSQAADAPDDLPKAA